MFFLKFLDVMIDSSTYLTMFQKLIEQDLQVETYVVPYLFSYTSSA